MRLLLVLLLIPAAASAQFPGLGRIKDKLDGADNKAKPVTSRVERAEDMLTPWTPEQEQAIGEASAEKMVAMFGLLNAPALEKYVNLVGSAVAQYASRDLPWRFGVLDANIVGAYSLPGGYVFITRASLAGMTNEAQLAGTLGHEIEHVTARHLETEIRARKGASWATDEASAKSGATGQKLIRAHADVLVQALFNTALSRSKEEDADAQGARMAARAGYAQNGLLQFLQVLQAANANPANRRFFGQMLSTHPSFEDRIVRLSALGSNRGKTLDARFRKAVGR